MEKIKTLFVRDEQDRQYVLPEVTPGCEWVTLGEGAATRKWDGTCTMLDEDGRWWARREVKPGKGFPPNYQLISIDPITTKAMGWEPIEQSAFAKFHAEALYLDAPLLTGTYELVGPKVNGNPEGFRTHHLIRHGWSSVSEDVLIVSPPPVTYDALRGWLLQRDWEGLVWHHPDGRMVKIKRRDFRAEA